MSEIFQVPAICTKVVTMSDGGLRLQIDTNELNDTEKAQVFSLHNKFGYFVFKEGVEGLNPNDTQDVPDIVPEFKTDKSPSQRMRNTLFRIYEKMTEKQKKKYPTFDDYYKHTMETYIEKLKAILEEMS